MQRRNTMKIIGILVGVLGLGIGLYLGTRPDIIQAFYGINITIFALILIILVIFYHYNLLNQNFWLIPGLLFVIFTIYLGYSISFITSPHDIEYVKFIPKVITVTPDTSDENDPEPTSSPEKEEILFNELIPPSLLKKVEFENVSKVFDDDFPGNEELWDLAHPPEGANIEVAIGDGSFSYSMVCIQTEGNCKDHYELPRTKEDNFILYFKSKIETENPYEWAFQGIKLRKQLGYEAYLLLFNAQKQYRMIRIDSTGKWIALYDDPTGTFSDFPSNNAFYKQGGWNEYIIYATDTTIELYANGTLIEVFQENNIITDGEIFLYFQATHHQGISVKIDRVIVWELLN